MFEKVFRTLGIWMIAAYRVAGTTHLGGSCRFEPSCSEYAAEAWRTRSPMTALRMTLSRIWRCRPGGPFGYDPVPSQRSDHEVLG